MAQNSEVIRPNQASLSLEIQELSNDDAPFEDVYEEDTPRFVDCENPNLSSIGIIQKAAETSSEPRTDPPMGSIMECQPLVDSLRTPPHSPRRDLSATVSEICQRQLPSANKSTNIAVNQPKPAIFLPNDSKFPANYDQPAADRITTMTVNPVLEVTNASTNTEEVQEPPETPTTPAPVEEKAAVVEHQLKALCDKLQTEFLTPGQQPDPKHMRAMAGHLTEAEGIHQPPACVAARKLLKVLNRMTKLDHVPRDEKFGLKKRSQALREKWLDFFGDIILPRREPEHIIIDLTESADESPQSVENDVLNSPASSDTISPPTSGKPPAKRKRCLLTDSSPSSPEMGRGKRRRVTKIHLKAHFERENTVMQNCLRNVCQMIEGVSAEIERAQAKKEQLESMKDDLEAWVVQEEKVTCQLEKQN